MPAPKLSRVINSRYRLDDLLGKGAAGEVYLARDTLRGDFPLALKLLDTHAAGRPARESLKTEFFALSRLRHPHLVSVHDLGQDRDTGHWFMTLEYVQGPTLSAWKAQESQQYLDLARHLLLAMDFIHDRGFVHADIKPDNILMAGLHGDPRISDFGLAGLLGLSSSRRGTLPYTAPEVLRGEAPGRPADIYSMGATLYQVAYGQPPFTGETPDLIIDGHLRQEPDFSGPSSHPLPSGLPIILRRMLAKDPADRPVSGEEVVSALEDLTGSRSPTGVSASRRLVLRHGTLVGRESELAAIQARLEKLSGQDSGGVLKLQGAAGAGRTRVLDEVRIRAQLEGITVVRADCRGDEEDPYNCIHAMLADLHALSGEPAPPELAALLSATGETTPGPEPDRAQIHEAAAELVRSAATTVPLLLIVDDVHQGHPDLLDLLAHMIRGAAREPVLTILSTLTDDSSDSSPEALAALSGLEEITLPSLGENDSRKLIQSHLGRDSVPDEVMAELTRGQQGLPYLLVETTRAFLDAGGLELDAAGRWHLDRDRLQEAALPGSPQRAAALRRSLTAAAGKTLSALSVARQALNSADLHDMARIPLPVMQSSLDELTERGVLTRSEAGDGAPKYRFAQVLVRDAIYRSLEEAEPDERLRLHLARSQQLRRMDLPDPAALAELAQHLEALGRWDEAIDLQLEVARLDAQRGAPSGAGRHLRKALSLITGEGKSLRPQAPLWEELGDVDRAASRPEGADASYVQALEQVPADDNSTRARLLWKRATVSTLAGDTDAARRLLGRARSLARQADDRVTLARCFNALGNSFAREGDHLRAERYYRRGLRLRRDLGNEVDVSGSLINLGMVASFQGRSDEGSEMLRQALEISHRCDDVPGIAMVANNLGILAAGRGDLDEAVEHFSESEKAYQSRGALGRRAECLLNMARVLVRQGLYHRAVDMAREGLELRRRLGLYGETSEALEVMGSAFRESGRVEAALETHERALATARRHEDGVQESFALIALAADSLAHGDASSARERLEELAGTGIQTSRLRQKRHLVELQLLLVSGETAAARTQAGNLSAKDEESWDAADLIDLHLLRVRAGITLARFEDCLGELQTVQDRGILTNHPARQWELLRLRASALSGLSREEEAAAVHQEAVEIYTKLAARLPEDYRSALEASQAVARLRLDRGRAADSRSAPGRFLDTMYKVIEALTSVNDPDAMLERIMGLALDLLGAERGLILMFPEDKGEPRVAVARNVEEETIADAITYSCQVVDQGRLGRSLVAPDARADPRIRDYASVSLFQIQSVICVPLQARNRILGTVYLDSRSRVIGFNDDDLRFLEAFAQHAATALDNAGMLRALQKENLTLREQVLERYSFANIVGRSPAMQEVFETLKTVSASPLPVLIRGESGTGKELVARALHYNSLRKSGTFLSENCAAFPENLLESQLFGHVRGAFTGATTDQTGLFQEAHHGTLFLDEIGEMSPSLQARLTRVLETGELRPIGSSQPVQVDVRLIGATHRNLEEMVAAGTFRNDLLFRLNVISIDLPPLRERRDDIPLLVSHFIHDLSKELGAPAPGMSDGALELLSAREWRGNVRQLRNEISRLLVFHRGGVITADQVRDLSPVAAPPLDEYLDTSGRAMALKDLEKRHILRALKETQGDRTRAARLLRLGRATIFRKIKDYDLDV